jgi:hypothetical protein
MMQEFEYLPLFKAYSFYGVLARQLCSAGQIKINVSYFELNYYGTQDQLGNPKKGTKSPKAIFHLMEKKIMIFSLSNIRTSLGNTNIQSIGTFLFNVT